MSHRTTHLRIAILALSFPWAVSGSELRLASDGRTDYRIVIPAEPKDTDYYAAETLADYLELSTGAEFEIASADGDTATSPTICVGLSQQARVLLDGNPLAELEDQQHTARSVGPPPGKQSTRRGQAEHP